VSPSAPALPEPRGDQSIWSRLTACIARHPQTRSRRAVLAGIATAAVLPLAVAIPTTEAATTDPAFALIAEKLAADAAHGEAIDAQDRADAEFGYDSVAASEADESCSAACWALHEIDWRIARTPPTTLRGIAAVLRFANQMRMVA
jgi:hypothetical protein